jgi:hypothetical protein
MGNVKLKEIFQKKQILKYLPYDIRTTPTKQI